MMEGGYHFAALKGTTFMDPQVIADTALYLNSDLAAKVTGVTIPVGNRARRRWVFAGRHAGAQCRRCACRARHGAMVPRP